MKALIIVITLALLLPSMIANAEGTTKDIPISIKYIDHTVWVHHASYNREQWYYATDSMEDWSTARVRFVSKEVPIWISYSDRKIWIFENMDINLGYHRKMHVNDSVLHWCDFKSRFKDECYIDTMCAVSTSQYDDTPNRYYSLNTFDDTNKINIILICPQKEYGWLMVIWIICCVLFICIPFGYIFKKQLKMKKEKK